MSPLNWNTITNIDTAFVRYPDYLYKGEANSQVLIQSNMGMVRNSF